MPTNESNTAHRNLASLWHETEMPSEALAFIELSGDEPLLPTSFRVGVAAQSSIAAASLAASQLWHERTGQRQTVSLNRHDAEAECTGYFTIDGKTPSAWAKFSGLYPCKDGWVRIHANFDHHRDGALKLLGLGNQVEKDQVIKALSLWEAEAFESAAAEMGMVVSCIRTYEEWCDHPQYVALQPQPLVRIEKIADAPARPLLPIKAKEMPLKGVRVLDLTRILAGPVSGRTLANYGADVMLVNSPHLPNIDSIIDTSRGKLSCHIDLKNDIDKARLRKLVGESEIFIQGYRPGALEKFGLGAQRLTEENPGLIYVSLSAYGATGPWSDRRGFDSLVQSATGLNIDEAIGCGSEKPRALPVQILDYASGFLMAFGAQAALLRRAREGGSWHVEVSLARTAQWLRDMGRIPFNQNAALPDFNSLTERYDSAYGDLRSIPHAARFSVSRPEPVRPSVPPGTHQPVWPD